MCTFVNTDDEESGHWTFNSCGGTLWQEVCRLFCPLCEQLHAGEGSDVSVYDWRCAEGRRQPHWKVKGLDGRTPRAVLNILASWKNEIRVAEEVSPSFSMERTSLLKAGFMLLMAGEYLWK